MSNNSLYSLNLNDFSGSIRTVWEELRVQSDFCDVTLACEGHQIEAHKIILSGFSPVFKDLLQKNPHQHPLLYLRGVKYCELVNMLDFIYQGEIGVEQENLNSFVDICKEFQIKGLDQQTEKHSLNLKRSEGDDRNYPQTKKKKTNTVSQDNDSQQNFIKSESDHFESENIYVEQKEERNPLEADDMDYVCDDYDSSEENSNHELNKLKKKGKTKLNINKKEKKIIAGPKPVYEIIKNPRSSHGKFESPGVLIVSKKFIYHFNKWSKNRYNAYYCCAWTKSTGCKAKAIVSDSIFDDKGDEHVEEESIHGYVLSKWTDDDGHNHEGNPGRVIAERMMIEMSAKIEMDPSLNIQKTHDETIEKYKAELADEQLWIEVEEALGKVESRYRRLRKVRGTNSKSKDDFKPEISKTT